MNEYDLRLAKVELYFKIRSRIELKIRPIAVLLAKTNQRGHFAPEWAERIIELEDFRRWCYDWLFSNVKY